MLAPACSRKQSTAEGSHDHSIQKLRSPARNATLGVYHGRQWCNKGKTGQKQSKHGESRT